MTEPKKRGRPRKVMFDKNLNIVNPDEVPATRGYVKCIARRIDANSGHVHVVKESQFTYNLFRVFFVLALTSGIVAMAGYTNQIVFAACLVLIIISLCVIIAALPDYKIATEPSEIFSEHPEEFERWEPPEPKKEC